MKKLNKYLSLGLFFNAIWLISNHYSFLPDFIEGLCVGSGIALILIGVYAENHDISKLRNFKKNLFIRIFKNN